MKKDNSTINKIFSKKELEKILDIIITFDTLPATERFEYEFEQDLMYQKLSYNQFYFEFLKAILNWNFYLKLYIDKEEYEIAKKIQDVIDIEVKEYKSNLFYYFDDLEKEVEEEYINNILNKVKSQYHI